MQDSVRLVGRHFEIYPRGLRSFDMPNLRQLEGIVSAEVLQAMVEASEIFRSLGIPHALVGGLAVSAWSRPRWTKDVDFVVDHTAFDVTPSGVVSFKPGVPLQVRGVVVDPILPKEEEGHLFDALRNPVVIDGIPVLPVEALVYMKLEAGRSKDIGDVVEILHYGADRPSIAKYLETHAPGGYKEVRPGRQEAEGNSLEDCFSHSNLKPCLKDDHRACQVYAV
jgi:hypothetical protein